MIQYLFQRSKKNLKIFFFFIGVIGLSSASSLKAEENDRFLRYLDIPLFAGFKELKDDSLLFNGIKGRLIESKARGEGEVEKIILFYHKVLPELGWKALKQVKKCTYKYCKVKYSREKEKLTIEVSLLSKGQKITEVSYELAPKVP